MDVNMDVLMDDVLTPDVIADLLFEDFDECSTCSDSMNAAAATEYADKQPVISSAKSVMDIVKSVQPNLTLTEYGRREIGNWMTAYCKKYDAASVVRQYPAHASRYQNFFVESLPPIEGPKAILDIIQKICTLTVPEQQLSGGEIKQWENDTLEYLGGYCLLKARAKFQESSPILTCLSGDAPQGVLIPRMERKQGVLMYPSENYMFLLQHIYLKFAQEASRYPTNIDFNTAAKEVLVGQYYHRFVDKVKNMCEGEMKIEEIDSLLSYIVKLTIRMLSYSFARKLFYRMSKNVEKCRGLRGELKKIK